MEVGMNNSITSQQQENTRRKEKKGEKKGRSDNISCNVVEVVAMQVGIATTSIGVVAFLIVNE
jgi:hypothetical protein